MTMITYNPVRVIPYITIVMLCLIQTGFAQSRDRGSPEIEFADRLEELLGLPVSSRQTQQIAILFRMWARFNPAEAYEALHASQLPASLPLSVMESMTISSWLKMGPDAAMKAAINSSFPENLDMAFRLYAHQDGAEAFKLARSMGNRISTITWIGIIEGIASWDPFSAANYVIKLGDGGEKLTGGFIYSMSIKDAQAAIDWLLENFPDKTEHYDALTARFHANSPQVARDYISQLQPGIYRKKLTISLSRAEKIARGERPD